jgi:DNA-binding phage protein
MTPLNEILIQAMDAAKREEPGLTEPEIARRAGLAQSAVSRAKNACGPSTLAAVLDTLGFDIVLKKKKRQPSK